MSEYGSLKKEALDSVLVSADKQQIAFRSKSGWLYFYRGEIKSVSGIYLLDDKYGQQEGISLEYLWTSETELGVRCSDRKDYFTVIHKGLTFEGMVMERVLQENTGFGQLIEDFE